jgi:methylated-DNA-protein-cysteine methyltransferase related protein
MPIRRCDLYEQIYAVVRRIPRGRVATYGQIAELAGRPRQPRLVGYALRALPEEDAAPWHRVINARGEVSKRADPDEEEYQRFLLAAEGVEFDEQRRTSLARFQWHPRARTRGPAR